MSLWSAITHRETRASLAQPTQWLLDIFGARATASGVSVTHEQALGVAAVYRAVALLSETIAQVPLKVFRQLPNGEGRVEDPEHRLYPVLHDQANAEMTAFEFREALQQDLCLRGNAFAEIQRDASGRVVALWPLRAQQMQLFRSDETRRIRYLYQVPNGTQIAWEHDPTRPPILHIRAFSRDGIVGRSVIEVAREALGLALATQEHGARLFSNGATPGGVIEGPHMMEPDQHKRLAQSWNAAHRGLAQAHKVAILEHGFAFKPVGMPNTDAQFIEQRRFQVAEVARLFGVPPHMLGDLERATFSNIEHQSLEFVTHTMLPWARRWEQALRRDLLPRGVHRARFSFTGLLRGDFKTRQDGYAIGRQWGWWSVNDILRMEDRNPIGPEGDIRLTPMNMTPSDQIGAPPEEPRAAPSAPVRLARVLREAG